MAVARRRHRYESVLELTPLLDVIFLLLIFFMVSTSFVVNREILIQLPESSSA
ncbi:MAG TPA: biopolymer transporter ExbD, partial [Gammaproteobacteria bacterium]|nr:biopolymer transporter ExbD [Gammaproteobacteria bacterium]